LGEITLFVSAMSKEPNGEDRGRNDNFTYMHTYISMLDLYCLITIIIYSPPELVCRRFFDEGLLSINPSRKDDPVNGEG
jgi:hypothetical protein